MNKRIAPHEGNPHGANPHGGNRLAVARSLGCRPEQLLEASASLVPFGPPASVRRSLRRALAGAAIRDYPDREHQALRQEIAQRHGLEAARVLPGKGAAELFTWAGRDAAQAGVSLLPLPGFADYQRALACWQGAWRPLALPLRWSGPFPQPFAAPIEADLADLDTAATITTSTTSTAATAANTAAAAAANPAAAVVWITNPHNPTGQLWSRESLEPLLERFAMVIVDEAFLPLVPGGEAQSMLPWVGRCPGLVVIRSLTKLAAIPGLRLGYALADPTRLARWAAWRDPWPVNGLAAAAGVALMADRAWDRRVQGWLAREGPWLAAELAQLPGLVPMASAANFLLVRGERAGQPCSLNGLRLALEQRHRILVRDCRSFTGLGESWLRLAVLDRRGNRRLLGALAQELGG
ncbi:MAG: pyridoxal phosphate-dependent aminotransferase [Cyanobacteriota bacterium]